MRSGGLAAAVVFRAGVRVSTELAHCIALYGIDAAPSSTVWH